MTPALSSNEAQIRALIDERSRAVHAKDVIALMSHVASDTVSFDVVDPLQYVGAASTRERAEQWFASFDTPIQHECRDIIIVANDHVAFSHCLTRVAGTVKSGEEVDMWFRTTTGYRKVGDKWFVSHDHNSVPFDSQNGKASLNLKP